MPRGIPNKKKAEQANGQGISKLEAIRQALATIGREAMPTQLLEFVKSKFGIDMELEMVSNYKSLLGKKEAEQSRIIRKPKSAGGTSSGGISLDDIRAVKEVMDRLGAEKVRQLTEVLSK